MSSPTPAELGYYMPAEWQRHAATWLTWPKDPETWPDRVPQVQQIFIKMMEALTPHEVVNLLVDDEETEGAVRARCIFASAGNIRFHRIPTVDSWIRDYGPNFLVKRHPLIQQLVDVGQISVEEAEADVFRNLIVQSEGKEPFSADEASAAVNDKLKFIEPGQRLAYNDWIFNAWGNKYEELKRDDDIPRLLAPILNRPRFEPGIVMEGGSIDVNGAGVVLTTEQCLLNKNRNPALSREQIESKLRDYLGVQKVLWLGEGIVGDDTDGHIDDIARFVSPTKIVCALEDDPSDANYELLQENLERLKRMSDVNRQPFEIVTLPMPGIVGGASTDTRNLDRLPASYANFYIANKVVLAPIFGHANDERALNILRGLFPDREVVGINCEPLVWGMGTVHCVSQQEPAP
ncbi:MAG TPA: agmatine deiminase family protein [Pyrinomonadaceae bacterium]|nr:agmatine deiminase family protein [Pyrinomonadaceae bacterium]